MTRPPGPPRSPATDDLPSRYQDRNGQWKRRRTSGFVGDLGTRFEEFVRGWVLVGLKVSHDSGRILSVTGRYAWVGEDGAIRGPIREGQTWGSPGGTTEELGGESAVSVLRLCPFSDDVRYGVHTLSLDDEEPVCPHPDAACFRVRVPHGYFAAGLHGRLADGLTSLSLMYDHAMGSRQASEPDWSPVSRTLGNDDTLHRPFLATLRDEAALKEWRAHRDTLRARDDEERPLQWTWDFREGGERQTPLNMTADAPVERGNGLHLGSWDAQGEGTVELELPAPVEDAVAWLVLTASDDWRRAPRPVVELLADGESVLPTLGMDPRCPHPPFSILHGTYQRKARYALPAGTRRVTLRVPGGPSIPVLGRLTVHRPDTEHAPDQT